MTSPAPAPLAYYALAGPFTDLGPHAGEASRLSGDVASLVAVVQNLLIHRFWAQAYGVSVTPDRATEQGLHGAQAMLSCARGLQDSSISDPRPPDRRVVGICRHFATLLCAFLRLHGVPARARCGFAAYFEPGKYVDHWGCEYWRPGEARWVMVDPQLDLLQRTAVKPDFDPLDVPGERFWVAGQAWQRCRAGQADPSNFGIAHMWGLWYVRSNLNLDVASLNKVELLPWETWGLSGRRDQELTPDDLATLDTVARLSTHDDGDTAELRALYQRHPALRVPDAMLAVIRAADPTGGTGANPLTSG